MNITPFDKPFMEAVLSLTAQEYVQHCLRDFQEVGILPTNASDIIALERICELHYWRMREKAREIANARQALPTPEPIPIGIKRHLDPVTREKNSVLKCERLARTHKTL